MSKPEPAVENVCKEYPILSEKTVIWPTWRDNNEHLITMNDILGQFARWAVQQSPFTCPDHLEIAIKSLAERLREKTEFESLSSDFEFIKITRKPLEKLIDECLESLPVIMAWNKPKKGPERTFYFTDRYSTPQPDYDIIDIGALAKNITHSLIREAVLDADPPDQNNPDGNLAVPVEKKT